MDGKLRIADCGLRILKLRAFHGTALTHQSTIRNPQSAIAKSPRNGLTLFEVLIALSIFIGSMAALGQLVANGVRGAVHARLQTQAILRAESVMAEIIAGALPLEAVAGVTFAEDPSWTYSVNLSTGAHASLYLIEVICEHTASSNSGYVSFSLQRYMRDPQLWVDAAAAADAEAQEEASQTTTTTGGT